MRTGKCLCTCICALCVYARPRMHARPQSHPILTSPFNPTIHAGLLRFTRDCIVYVPLHSSCRQFFSAEVEPCLYMNACVVTREMCQFSICDSPPHSTDMHLSFPNAPKHACMHARDPIHCTHLCVRAQAYAYMPRRTLNTHTHTHTHTMVQLYACDERNGPTKYAHYGVDAATLGALHAYLAQLSGRLNGLPSNVHAPDGPASMRSICVN